MSLVLNGKGRVMVGQLFRDAQADTERDSVQQQPAASTENAAPTENATPTSPDVAKSVMPSESATPVAQPGAFDSAVAKNQLKDQVSKIDTSKMKSHYFSVLDEAGVQIRAIDPENRNKFFTRGGNPSDGSASGMFLVPSRMADGQEVNDAAAQEIAKKVIGPFKGVNITNWSETKGGYRFDWHNRNEMNTGITGTSFDELLGEGKKKSAGVTIGEMIQSRRDELYNTMRKIAQGDK